MKTKVLLIYPTMPKITGLHVGLATLSAVLKEKGHDVKIFDTAFYFDEKSENQTKIRAERGMSKKIEDEDKYIRKNDASMEDDIIKLTRGYQPDIIGISILEVVYDVALRLCAVIKGSFKDIPIVAGGICPSLSPEKVINEDAIDIVCIGEGESAMTDLCDRISKNKSLTDIEGLWVKEKGSVHRNTRQKLHDINELPHPDYTEFDERLFYKPMQGRMYKMVNISTSRGCAFNCAFCAAPQLRKFYKDNASDRYNRRMDVKRSIDQIYYEVKRHNPEFIYFSSESFLSMPEKEFDMFIEEYDKIRIPFWIQTRVETITRKHLSQLRRVGMHWMTIGLEHGNENFRKQVLKRNYSNKMFIEKMDILKDLNMGASVNNMIGLPFETRELIFDTIGINRELLLRNPKLECNAFLFTPYKGCELYDVLREHKLLDDVFITASAVGEESVIKFPKAFKKELAGLVRTFNFYVRLPEKFYPDIRIAEQHDKIGSDAFYRMAELIQVYQ